MKSKEPDFVCPNCGADVPGGSESCPECGSDDRTGWSEDTYLDGVTLPGEDDGPEDGKPAGTLDRGRWIWVAVALGLLAVAVGFRLIGVLR